MPLINVVGAFALGAVIGGVARRPADPRARTAQLFLGTGVLGGFTTYSALAARSIRDPALLALGRRLGRRRRGGGLGGVAGRVRAGADVTPLVFVAAAAAGGVGAALRYVLDIAANRMLGTRLPWGILAVNLTGSFALGLVSAGLVDATGVWVLGAGLLGGYTTFSSVAVTTAVLADERRVTAATVYAVGTFVGATVAAFAGAAVGALLA